LNFYEKERAQDNKERLLIAQNGKCFYFKQCKTDFVKDNIYPEAAHIIINSKVNIKKYGHAVLRHEDNFVLTCKECNSKAILTPESIAGELHIEAILEQIQDDTMQEILDRR